MLADLMKQMTSGIEAIPSESDAVFADQIPVFVSSIIETTNIFHQRFFMQYTDILKSIELNF